MSPANTRVGDLTLYLAPKMNRPGDGNIISIDPNGDRSLIVGTGENQKVFRVSSKAMCLASPVWKAMFAGPFKEATAQEISFPEAEPNALLITLRIAHLQFKELPSFLDFHQLLNLAVVCDVYDLVSIVRPFLTGWITASRPIADRIGYEEWLLVAWTFGYREEFERSTCRLVLCVGTNEDGQCLTETNKVLKDFMAPGIIESILRTRNSVLSDIIDVCHLHLERFKSGTSQHCQAGVNMAQCDALTVGSLVRGFEPLGLWPERPDPSEIFTSVSKLTDALRDIQIHTLLGDVSKEIADLKRCLDEYDKRIKSYSTYNYPGQSTLTNDLSKLQQPISTLVNKTSANIHKGCNFKKKFDEDIQNILDKIPSAVLDSHLQHMEEQSKK